MGVLTVDFRRNHVQARDQRYQIGNHQSLTELLVIPIAANDPVRTCTRQG